MEATWGLLGPEFLPNARRTRTLGLGASVRSFNDLAVPGLGGVWYGKQLLLATLGVAVAEEARSRGAKVQNIEMADAIEALACWLALKSNDWSRDARLRGNSKLQGKTDFGFQQVRQRNFYVTQPMRMATVQALPALGFAESNSARFNSFCCSNEGRDFIEKATEDYRPYNRTVIDHLTWWAQMKDDNVNTDALQQALSPLNRLSDEAIPLLRERLIQGGNESFEDKKRRGNALAWVEALRKGKIEKWTWAQRPQEISEEHWHDLQAGALFFEAREAAIAVLDAVEISMGPLPVKPHSLKALLPEELKAKLELLKSAANRYLEFKHADEEANKFCRECVNDDPSSILRTLVNRDGHVLRLAGDEVKPGQAFRGSTTQVSADDEDQEAPQAGGIPLPEGISYRVRNLYLLNLDMHGELDGWLTSDAGGGEA
ncbi:MAG: hypothetical protein GJU73_04595 [Ferrovum sp.]|jgi:hypothetical protein|uniref:hypothetical protein n=1 Tax=Ferrovum sp. TaxID=2609467 RepID=UPI002629E209|nr:hypothetical protein [Ferrovum sp.]MBW8066706.1 hypothetical protein [Ferrovum sp.]